MCRHLAYIGAPIDVRDLVFESPHALAHQARAPRHQPPDRINGDGWGVMWWPTPDGPARRYRSATTIWDDTAFGETPTASTVIAAARLASPGATLGVENNAPFRDGPWAFSLNGWAFVGGRADPLRARLSPERRDGLIGDSDSEVLFALVLDQLDAGATPGEALGATVEAVAPDENMEINLLLTNGSVLAATRHRNSLYVRRNGGVTVASEPLDDDPGWHEVADGSILTEGPL